MHIFLALPHSQILGSTHEYKRDSETPDMEGQFRLRSKENRSRNMQADSLLSDSSVLLQRACKGQSRRGLACHLEIPGVSRHAKIAGLAQSHSANEEILGFKAQTSDSSKLKTIL